MVMNTTTPSYSLSPSLLPPPRFSPAPCFSCLQLPPLTHLRLTSFIVPGRALETQLGLYARSLQSLALWGLEQVGLAAVCTWLPQVRPPTVREGCRPACLEATGRFADAFDCVVCSYQAVSLRALDLRGNPQSGAHSPIGVISAIQARYSDDDHTQGWMLIHVRWRTVHCLGIRYDL